MLMGHAILDENDRDIRNNQPEFEERRRLGVRLRWPPTPTRWGKAPMSDSEVWSLLPQRVVC